MEALTLDAFMSYRYLSQIRFSPDGRRAAFVRGCCEREENAYQSAIYLYEQGQIRQLTGLEQEAVYFWEDESHLLFPAVRSKQEKKRKDAGEVFTAYYRIAADGGEALPAFTLPLSCGELFPFGDGRYYTFSKVDANHPDLYRASKEELEAYRKEDKANEDYFVLEENPFCENGGSFINRERNGLFVVDPRSGDCLRISAPCCSVDAAARVDGPL